MSQTILIIDKSGEIKELKVKPAVVVEDLYKKCGFKKNTDFGKQTTWTFPDGATVSLYGKKVGKSNFENKYEFPPPVDKELYFGSVCLVAGGGAPLTKERWATLYAELFGGFDETGSADDDDEEEEDEEDEDVELTKSGYVKDKFVVEDDEEEEYEPKKPVVHKKMENPVKKVLVKSSGGEEDSDSEADECEEEKVVVIPKKKRSSSGSKKKEAVVEEEINIVEDELVEEEYLA